MILVVALVLFVLAALLALLAVCLYFRSLAAYAVAIEMKMAAEEKAGEVERRYVEAEALLRQARGEWEAPVS